MVLVSSVSCVYSIQSCSMPYRCPSRACRMYLPRRWLGWVCAVQSAPRHSILRVCRPHRCPHRKPVQNHPVHDEPVYSPSLILLRLPSRPVPLQLESPLGLAFSGRSFFYLAKLRPCCLDKAIDLLENSSLRRTNLTACIARIMESRGPGPR